MKQHTLQALEFHRVRELLVTRAASVPGAERAAALAPARDAAAARALLETVAEALALHASEPAWPRLTFPDIRDALGRARVSGAVLEPADFPAVARCLAVAREVGSFFATPAARSRRPRLAGLAAGLFSDSAFEERVARSFEPSGELSDRASPELRRLRRELLSTRQQAGAQMEELARHLGGGAEETVVTLRGGRYVLGIAAAEKRRVKGIVHDRSATGKTLYLEPLAVIELNNALAELEADERLEIRRILLELTAWVRDHSERLAGSLKELAALDEFDARARLARDLKGSLAELDEAGTTLRIVAGRHPLLHLALGDRVVALDLTLEGERRGIVVSGPNMGGKTVVLKTVGLLTLMAMAGLFVPAREGTVIPWVDGLLVDIGDEQSLEDDLSTYGARLRNMQAMLAEATGRTLVLVDELGAGTDPEEGAALGQALLAELARRRTLCVVTTHHGSFKGFAAETPGFENAAVAYDPESLRPTFRLQIGLPGRSHAFELARREHWPEATLAEAAGLLTREGQRSEELLARIDAHRVELERSGELLREREAALEAERAGLQGLSQSLREKLEAVQVAKAVEEDQRLRALQELLQSLRAKLEEWGRAETPANQAALRRSFHAQEREAAELVKARRAIPRSSPRRAGVPLPPGERAPGTRAYARSLGVEVSILEADEAAEKIWVAHRGMRIALPPHDLLSLDGDSGEEAAAPAARISGAGRRVNVDLREEIQAHVSAEVDLRGLSADECRGRLELYLDRAVLAGYPRVRIVHGKGAGILRRVVREMLEGNRAVRSFRDGEGPEGGWGVTIALLGEAEARPASSEPPEVAPDGAD